jgi:hypothetical protein
MPYWGWILLIAGLSALAVASVYVITHATQRRLPDSEPLHGDHTDIAAPVPLHVAEADSMTERELDAERSRDGSRAPVSPDR